MLPAEDNSSKNRFRKQDKLKSSIEIDTLYRENKFVVSFPLKCYYSFSEIDAEKNSLRVAFAVPKKTFKHAVDRNTLKRRMREAYRLNYKKIFEEFISQKEKQLKLFIIYIEKEKVDYHNIHNNMLIILKKVNDKW